MALAATWFTKSSAWLSSRRGEVFAGTLALGFLGTAVSLPRPIRPYRRRVNLWGISPRFSSRRKQSGSVLVWQCVGCTAVCSPKQSRVISEFPRRVNILEAALLVPVSAAFSTAYRGRSLCWLHMLAGAPRLPEPFFASLGHPVLRLGSPGSMRVPAHVADGCSPCKMYRIRVFLASSRKERRSTSACVLEGHMLCNVH